MTSIRSRSVDQTKTIGAAIAPLLRPGDVVVLTGDLGAGKTAFVQGAARGLGVDENVTSPSFVLVREYPGVTHADVYRLNHLQELFDLGYEEVFAPDRVAFVEWGDAVEGALPEDRLEVRIAREPDDSRTIALEARGDWVRRIGAVETALSSFEGAS